MCSSSSFASKWPCDSGQVTWCFKVAFHFCIKVKILTPVLLTANLCTGWNEVTDVKLLCKLQSMVCVNSLTAVFVVFLMSYSLVFTCECFYSRKLQQWKQLNIVTKTPDKNEWYFTFLCQPACYISADLWKPQHIFNLHLFKSWTCCFPWGGWDQRGKAGGGGRPRGRLLRGSCPVPVWWMGQTMKVFSDDLKEGSISSVSPHDFAASRGQHQKCG